MKFARDIISPECSSHVEGKCLLPLSKLLLGLRRSRETLPVLIMRKLLTRPRSSNMTSATSAGGDDGSGL